MLLIFRIGFNFFCMFSLNFCLYTTYALGALGGQKEVLFIPGVSISHYYSLKTNLTQALIKHWSGGWAPAWSIIWVSRKCLLSQFSVVLIISHQVQSEANIHPDIHPAYIQSGASLHPDSISCPWWTCDQASLVHL